MKKLAPVVFLALIACWDGVSLPTPPDDVPDVPSDTLLLDDARPCVRGDTVGGVVLCR